MRRRGAPSMGRLAKCEKPAVLDVAWNPSGCLALNSREARRLLRCQRDYELHFHSHNSMKRLRFNLLQSFPAQNYRQLACHARRRWNGSVQHVTKERVEKVFTTPRKTFHHCRK